MTTRKDTDWITLSKISQIKTDKTPRFHPHVVSKLKTSEQTAVGPLNTEN